VIMHNKNNVHHTLWMRY